MKTFEVIVSRIGYSSHTFQVKAENQDQANDLADQLAQDTEFTEHDAEYQILFTEEK